MARWVCGESSEVFLKLLVARRMCGGEPLGRNQGRHNAFDVPAAACAERETEPAGLRMQLNQSFNRTQSDQDGEGLIELLDHVERRAHPLPLWWRLCSAIRDRPGSPAMDKPGRALSGDRLSSLIRHPFRPAGRRPGLVRASPCSTTWTDACVETPHMCSPRR